MGGQHTLLSASAALVGAISYAATLLMAHLLPVDGYTDYAAVVSLLGTVGVASSALVPLPLAAVVRAHPAGSLQRRRAMSFALTVAVLAGVLAAGALAAITSTFASTAVVAAAAAAGFALLLIAPAWGVLQGQGRFGSYAAGSVGEVAVRVAFGIVAVGAGWGAGGALAGFLAGALVVLLIGFRAVGADLGWQPSVIIERARWNETGGIAIVQLVLSALAGLDVVLIAVLAPAPTTDPTAATAAAGYQTIAALTKSPLYIAAGAVLVSYPLLRTATTAARDKILRSALRSFAALAVPAAAILATAPPTIVTLALPATLAGSVRDLPWLAAAGLGYATLTVLHLALLGVGATRRCLAGLAPAALLLSAGLILGWQTGGIHGMAIGAAAGSLTAALAVLVLAAPHLPRITPAAAGRALLITTALIATLVATRSQPIAWSAVVVVIGLVVLRRATRRPVGRHTVQGRRAQQRELVPSPARPRILHLGFEDPAMPGAGGGSVRTHAINRRLAATADITVLTTRYPGCRDRIQDDVRYIHIGVGTGRTRLTRVLGYMLLLP